MGWRTLWVVISVASLAGCAASDPSAAPGDSGSGGASGGSSGQGGASTGGSGLGGAGSGVSCTGAFGAPRTLWIETQSAASSLSVTDDELEIYYIIRDVILDAGATLGEYVVKMRTRQTKSALFSDPVTLTQLSDVCAAEVGAGTFNLGGVDVSGDGLRLYFSCYDELADVGSVHLAERSDRNSAFTLNAGTFGSVSSSLDVTRGELTLLAVAGYANGGTPETVMHTRASTAEPFGTAIPVPGVPSEFHQPDLARDGLHLYGSMRDPVTAVNQLAVAVRTDPGAAFGPPAIDGLPFTTGSEDYTPAISADCRTLYFERLDGTTNRTMMYAVR